LVDKTFFRKDLDSGIRGITIKIYYIRLTLLISGRILLLLLLLCFDRRSVK
jgi:hypothetical protein